MPSNPNIAAKSTTTALNIERVAILLVDDNPFMRDLVTTVLKTLGCREIKEAPDGLDALALLDGGYVPDIMIVNWQMPRMDGIEFVRTIRQSEENPCRFVPVIMISGHSERPRILAARDAGVNEFLVKPMSVKLLYNRIVKLVREPRAFVKCPGFFGPDRRRRGDPRYGGPDRRQQAPENAPEPATDAPKKTDPRPDPAAVATKLGGP